MRLALLLTLATACALPPAEDAVPAPDPAPRACSNICNSNLQCSGILQRCQFCSFGNCSESRPSLLDCQRACAPDVEPRPVWCDLGACGDVLRAEPPGGL